MDRFRLPRIIVIVLFVFLLLSCSQEQRIPMAIYFSTEDDVFPSHYYVYRWEGTNSDDSIIPERPIDPGPKDGKSFLGWKLIGSDEEFYDFSYPIRSGSSLEARYESEKKLSVTIDGRDYQVDSIKSAPTVVAELFPLKHINAVYDSDGNLVTSVFEEGKSYTTEGYDLITIDSFAILGDVSYSGENVISYNYDVILQVTVNDEFSNELKRNGEKISIKKGKNSWAFDESTRLELSFYSNAEEAGVISFILDSITSSKFDVSNYSIDAPLRYFEDMDECPIEVSMLAGAERVKYIIKNVTDRQLRLFYSGLGITIWPNSSTSIWLDYNTRSYFHVNGIEHIMEPASFMLEYSQTLTDEGLEVEIWISDDDIPYSIIYENEEMSFEAGEHHTFLFTYEHLENSGAREFTIKALGNITAIFFENSGDLVNIDVSHSLDSGVDVKITNENFRAVDITGDETFSLAVGESRTFHYDWEQVISENMNTTNLVVNGVEVSQHWPSFNIDLSEVIEFVVNDGDNMVIIPPGLIRNQGYYKTEHPAYMIEYADNALAQALKTVGGLRLSPQFDAGNHSMYFSMDSDKHVLISDEWSNTTGKAVFEVPYTFKVTASLPFSDNTLISPEMTGLVRAYEADWDTYYDFVIEGLYHYLQKYSINSASIHLAITPFYKIYVTTDYPDLIGTELNVFFRNMDYNSDANQFGSFIIGEDGRSESVLLRCYGYDKDYIDISFDNHTVEKLSIPDNYPVYTVADIYDFEYEIEQDRNYFEFIPKYVEKETGIVYYEKDLHLEACGYDYSSQDKIDYIKNTEGEYVGLIVEHGFSQKMLFILSDVATKGDFSIDLTRIAFDSDYIDTMSTVTETINFEALELSDIISTVKAQNAFHPEYFSTAKLMVKAVYNNLDSYYVDYSDREVIIESYEQGKGISYENVTDTEWKLPYYYLHYRLPSMSLTDGLSYNYHTGNIDYDVVDYQTPIKYIFTFRIGPCYVTMPEMDVPFRQATVSGEPTKFDFAADVYYESESASSETVMKMHDVKVNITNNGNKTLIFSYAGFDSQDNRGIATCSSALTYEIPVGQTKTFVFDLSINLAGLENLYPKQVEIKFNFSVSDGYQREEFSITRWATREE